MKQRNKLSGKGFMEVDVVSGKKRDIEFLLRFIYLPITFVFFEFVLRLCLYRKLTAGFFVAAGFSLVAGALCTALTLPFHKVINRIIFYFCLSVWMIYYCTQLIYFSVFQRYLSFSLATAVGTDVLQFKHQIFSTIANRWYGIVLMLMPLLVRIVLDIAGHSFNKRKKMNSLILTGLSGALLLFLLLVLLPGRKKVGTAGNLFYTEWESNAGTSRLGLVVSAVRDFRGTLFQKDTPEDLDILVTDIGTTPTKTPLKPTLPPPTTPPEKDQDPENPSAPPEPTAEPTPTEAPLKYHELYDFAVLAEQEKNEKVKTLHSYFASLAPDPVNEYTGMFEGYNLIMLTAEGFSPWAVDKTLTPTLYKLTHEGFVFENFYTSLWYTSTSDGEYTACTGLVPDGSNSMKRTSGNDMRFAFGHQFRNLSYTTLAYHNHTYTYYGRDKTHPNLGYDYEGIGNGMVLPTNVWPRSDLEMMEATVPEYIGKEPFHVYYMTVSGHMEYTFNGNSMAYRNKDVVKDLPYSDEGKAYIACNYELEKALTYLIAQLTEAGIADRTVIALSADHYPYGLAKEHIDEIAGHEVESNFELYKNNFILWTAGMKEPVHISKYCSSLDIAPTIANLFNLPYDSRLYAGQDILSDREGFVILYNKSFITDRISYNSTNGKTISFSGQGVSAEYLAAKIKEVKQKFVFSKQIIDLDYFSYLPK